MRYFPCFADAQPEKNDNKYNNKSKRIPSKQNTTATESTDNPSAKIWTKYKKQHDTNNNQTNQLNMKQNIWKQPDNQTRKTPEQVTWVEL